MRIAYLRKNAQRLGLWVDSKLVFKEDTKKEVVALRKDGAVLCIQPVYLNGKRKIYDSRAFLLTFLGTQRITKSTQQALDCLKVFAK